MKYTIARHMEGCSLNPKEYVLDDDGEVQLFDLKTALSLIHYDSIEAAHDDGFYIEEED